MSALYGCVVTAAGRNLFAKLAATEQPLKIAQVMFGDGKMPEGSTTKDMMDMVDLISPFAPGTSTTPIHKDDTLSMVLQFRSDLNGGLQETKWINEYGLFLVDPDVGQVLAVYGTLGDYPDSVLAYDQVNQIVTTRDYPISIVIGAVSEIILEYSAAAFITSEDAQKLIEAAIAAGTGSVALSSIPVLIPASAWLKDDTKTGRYVYYADVADEAVSASHLPDVILDITNMEIAANCGMAPTVYSSDGSLRFYAQTAPESDISGACRLLTTGGGSSGGGGERYILPVATATKLGGIKASDSVVVEADGTAHAYAKLSPEQQATSEDMQEMMDEVFGTDGGDTAE